MTQSDDMSNIRDIVDSVMLLERFEWLGAPKLHQRMIVADPANRDTLEEFNRMIVNILLREVGKVPMSASEIAMADHYNIHPKYDG